ncbi:CYFA0S10e03290g1_1 [Cyberlindnera fabianii]|uniref:CYFA0S10e03290g1_1 n=1 Tax=Cyberlindnera fabianii TaxID=36022 RepID=A0A061B052_CYBFA|nr:CYFA0S10e03290g1_1 [Cyberlindnera fabianii]
MLSTRLLCRSALRTGRSMNPLSALTLRRLQSSVSTPPTSSGNTTSTEETDDYPDVPRELYYYRDPDAKWDDPQNRRNFGQPLHPDDDLLNLWSPHYYDTVSDAKALQLQFIFFGAVGAFSAIMYYFFYPERNAVPRDYPDGLARDFGARNEEEGNLYGVRIDKSY